MSGAPAEALALLLLAASLGFALVRPLGLAEAFVALPAAGLLVVTGVVPAEAAGTRLSEIGPTVGFLAAVLLLGHLSARAGVFEYLGARAARAGQGDPTRSLGMIVALAAIITASLTLDATVILLTPIAVATARRLRLSARPYTFACLRLANSGSLLLPVSNLTNLLAFSATGLSFGRFTALMAAPWLLVCLGEWLLLRHRCREDLSVPPVGRLQGTAPAAPRYALVVLVLTVAGFVVSSTWHVAPAWAAVGGCLALLVPPIMARSVMTRSIMARSIMARSVVARSATRGTPWAELAHQPGPIVCGRRLLTELLARTSPGFCLFVLALAVIVDGVTRHGLGDLLDAIIPGGTSFPALLGLAAVAALLANIGNNLPATLALIPLVASSPASVLAMLIGVNIGPNAAYSGSLATLLWRRQTSADDRPGAAEFHLVGLLSVPILLTAATAALFGALQLVGA